MAHFVYSDNAATTRISDTALDAMLPWLKDGYGNASSVYKLGRESRRALDLAREKMATALGAMPEEIIFTGSGTEADNWAIRGIAAARGAGHIITSQIEHHGILHTVEDLEKQGFTATYLPVDEHGAVRLDDLAAAIRPDTILISIMYANNEIGTIQPVDEIGALAREKGVLFHTDAVQAAGHLPIDLSTQPIDLLSLSAHKFHGPKGVGALYVRRGVKLPSFITGGGQERGKRAGTENLAGIIGMAAALEESVANLSDTTARLVALQEKLIEGLSAVPVCRLTGHPTHRLPGHVSVAFACVEGEALLLMLDAVNICASSGSACTSGSLDPSHVLLAIGLSHEIAHGSVRFSLGTYNTDADVDYILAHAPAIVEKLRAMSPLWEG